MKSIFMILSVIITAILLMITAYVRKQKSEYSLYLVHPMIVGTFANIFYYMFLRMETYTMALIFDELYFMCTDIIVLTMMLFTFKYTHAPKKISRYLAIAFSILVCADSISLLVNTWTQHLFTLEPYYINGLLYWHLKMKFMHYLHLLDCYIIVTVSFVNLIKYAIITPSYYKSKYIGIIIAYLVVLIVNFTCYSLDLPVDYSVLLYAILAGFITYFSIYSVPKLIISNLLVSIYDSIKDIVLGFNSKGEFLYGNKKAKKLFVYEGKFDNLIVEEYLLSKTYQQNDEIIENLWDEEIEEDGKLVKYHVDYQKLFYSKRLIGSFLKFQDRTKEIERFVRERNLATHDKLTGLINAEYFFEKTAAILMANPNEKYLMLCSNIKDFRLVNEFFGRDTGDAVLKKQAELLAECSHPTSLYARVGDDKFGILVNKKLFHTEIFDRSIEALSKLTESSIYQMHIFIGVYEITDITENPKTMFDKALMAIEDINDDYQITFGYYNTDLMDRLLAERNIINDVDTALETHQFEMYLQAQVDTKGTPLGAEALVRWKHPEKGMIYPNIFIPILEKTGLIYKVDKFIWEEAAIKLSEWKKQGITHKHISVNISAKDFYYVDIYQEFVNLVQKYDIDPANLRIEITETFLMTNLKGTMELFRKLQEKGFYVEIDDFGSGYSSLNMLKDINADVLKIDMGFLRETENRKKSRIILESIISMSKELDMTVITEGVETVDQAEMLTTMGCDMFQGYYYSKPIPVSEFEEKFLTADKY